ncbi:MAG TPA: hypothetical protein VN719_04150 [Gemmatimonadales bacterium]|nr:hypothetical protein [Gemmatimonadales bacterium]
MSSPTRSETCQYLKAGGLLVSVCPSGFTYAAKPSKRLQQFIDLVEMYGRYEFLPEGSFKGSSTNINTCLVTLHKGPKDQSKPNGVTIDI